jgi:hypothetical protein
VFFAFSGDNFMEDGMRKTVALVALAAGLAGPASAATVLDFTTDNATSGTVEGVGYNITAQSGGLVNAVHWNDSNCGIYACDSVSGGFDVGFGISGGANGNEIDAGIEAVVVTFNSLVKIVGFAGMLTYFDDVVGNDEQISTEAVQLEYSVNGGLNWLGLGDYIAYAEESGNPFDTVGLAFLDNLSIIANAVRFTATGIGNGDDGTLNVTAAALTVAPVPVPASFPLLLAGIGALGFAARRKRKAA